jgi:putative transposase
MPEHVHLLVSEPPAAALSKVILALKVSVSGRLPERPFWLKRYYDFNVFSERKRGEKLRYMHRNPVKRGLVSEPDAWEWSSFHHYLTGEVGVVEVESWWTLDRRGRGV